MRRITAIVLSLLLIMSLALPASAAASGTFLLDKYDITEDALYCYGKLLPAGGTLTVSVGAKKVESARFSTLGQEKVPVTVYCLVDASSSLPESVMQQQEDFLLTLSSRMEGQDNMVLGLLDKTLAEGKPLPDKASRDTAITTIQRKNWVTNLYQGISQAVDSVCTNTAYHTNSCLIILSDGHDDGQSGVTGDQVLEKIQAAGIPVYSVVLSASGSNVIGKDLKYQEQFAEESLGGFLCHPYAEDISTVTAAERIWDSIQGASAIRIDLKEFQDVQSDQELLIRYDIGDTRYEDTILVRAVDLASVASETQPSTETGETSEPEVEATEGNGEKEDKEIPLAVWIAAGGIVLLLAGGLTAVILLMNKKKARQEEAVPVPEDAYNNNADPFPGQNSFPETEAFPETDPFPGRDFSSPKTMPTSPVSGGCHVYAVALMHPEVTAEFWVPEKVETTFGRSEQAEIQLCGKDMKLSGIHGCFLWDGKKLFVRDKNSRNGTAVNGGACTSETWLLLEDGATLRAGAYEYRISIQED